MSRFARTNPTPLAAHIVVKKLDLFLGVVEGDAFRSPLLSDSAFSPEILASVILKQGLPIQ